ncbi:MAG: SEC-C domain-containing protein [Actinomycetota bacterium]|nr:SEC-C domain-containing protein [Actinomycetota bacterium]
MGKRSRQRADVRPGTETDRGAVAPRQPCPCGSGKRYKACHGGANPSAPYVTRPFEGLPSECDWVALRDFVPAATAALTLSGGSDRSVTLCSLLPVASPAMTRADGAVWLGLQVQHSYGDPSRDLAYALGKALDAERGSSVTVAEDPGPGPRMQDVISGQAPLDVRVHEGFDFWVADVEDPTGQLAASLESANAAAWPTARLDGVDAAYWTRMGEREYVRWVMPHAEASLLDALARLHAKDADRMVDDSRLIGSFRAHGLVVPVWEVPAGTSVDRLAAAATDLQERIGEALSDTTALTPEQRSARNGITSRQVTIS